MKTIVIIPAYNEQTTIREVVDSVKKLNFINEVVVVDDGSSDQTSKRAKESGAIVLKHVINRGYGASLMTGTAYALQQDADFMAHFDADGQFEAKDIKEAIEPLQNGEVDIILGSRFLGKKSNVPFVRYLLLKTAIIFNGILTGVYLSDAHNGFRVFTRKAAEIMEVQQERMAYCTELLSVIRKANLRFMEISVKVHYTDYSRHKGQDSFFGALKIVKDLLVKKAIR